MAANKVIVNNQTILDLTADTVTAATLKKGVTAHDASGAQITGTMEEASTSETWVLNNTVDCGQFGVEGMATNFISNSQRFIGLFSRELGELIYSQDEDDVSVFNEENSTWIDTAYRKLVFDTPPTGDLLEWLTANGVKQPANLAVQPSKDVTVTSNGTTEITPDAPYDVLEKANLTVNVSNVEMVNVSFKDTNFNWKYMIYSYGPSGSLICVAAAVQLTSTPSVFAVAKQGFVVCSHGGTFGGGESSGLRISGLTEVGPAGGTNHGFVVTGDNPSFEVYDDT